MHRTYQAIGLLPDYPNPKHPIQTLTLTLTAEPQTMDDAMPDPK